MSHPFDPARDQQSHDEKDAQKHKCRDAQGGGPGQTQSAGAPGSDARPKARQQAADQGGEDATGAPDAVLTIPLHPQASGPKCGGQSAQGHPDHLPGDPRRQGVPPLHQWGQVAVRGGGSGGQLQTQPSGQAGGRARRAHPVSGQHEGQKEHKAQGNAGPNRGPKGLDRLKRCHKMEKGENMR